jgi:tRNA-Thr(GGU) m(6)t(6)A37 methyltransferase TsaA
VQCYWQGVVKPIGVVRSIYKEKFGIPRQPGLVESARGVIELNDEPFLAQATKMLDQFTHLWVIFIFHRHDAKNWKPSIRPPRLGGARKVGVLASRSPHRPNPIGLSAVKLERIEQLGNQVKIHVSGLDILDGSPVLDIKPYLPYADSIPQASNGWAADPIPRKPVEFTEQALQDIADQETRSGQRGLQELITETVALDPRPTSQRRKLKADAPESVGTRYGFAIEGCDVKWEITSTGFRVLAVEELGPEGRPKS